MPTHTNRLIEEKSPYLLQHAHNPVEWYPWGEEAFQKAASEDKPIFLSIGYATCHWCHVMEHESFENEEIANLMNEAFVCIKVDREERPDIDNIYMTVCQMMTGQGGWPLTILMTPDQEPFFAATYIPPEQRFGRLGMKQLIPRISAAWQQEREKVLDSAGQITRVLAQQQAQGSGARLHVNLLDQAYESLMQEYDSEQGGFGSAPKFPTPHRLLFLLRYGEERGIHSVKHTVKQMRSGGIFDQVGFGFHRYSTDDRWLLPHFEKMLYDQALMTYACTEAFERTGNPFFRRVAEETFTYVLRDMTAPEGGFYSAEDADSEGEEGVFYVWDADELKNVLGDHYADAAAYWNVRLEGNFHDESTGQATGKNILHLSALPDDAQYKKMEPVRRTLFTVREKRVHPLKDTKVLADWNGLMIAALAKAARAFDQPEYTAAAEKAADFIGSEMQQENGRLRHRWREGHTAVSGQLEDYAFMIHGLLELYETTFNVAYLERALAYQAVLSISFADAQRGGYFMVSEADAESLIVRPKELVDGALPSGNSMQLLNLLRLARLTGRSEFEEEAIGVEKAFSGSLHRSPSNYAQALAGLLYAHGDGVEIVVAGPDTATAKPFIDYINTIYLPNKAVLLKTPENADRLARLAPFTEALEMKEGRTTVYVCRNFSCEQPVHSVEELKQKLQIPS